MKTSILPLVLLSFAAPATAGELISAENPARIPSAAGLYFSGQAFFGNDVVPLRQINKDWRDNYAPAAGKNLALIASRVESGVAWQGFRLGLLSRNEWLAIANRDTLDIIRADRQKAAYDTGRTYDLDYRLKGFAANGLRLSKAIAYPLPHRWQVSWGGAISLLRGQRIRHEDIAGSATAIGGRTYVANFIDWKRDYSHTNTSAEGFVAPYLDGAPSGAGYSIDLGLSLERQDGLRVEWTVSDAISRIHWREIPEKTLVGSSLPTAALPSGRMWRVELNQHIPVKHKLSLTIPTAIGALELADTLVERQHLPEISLSTRMGNDWQARVAYDTHFSTLGLDLSYRWLHLRWRSDALAWNKMRAFGFGIDARWDF